MPATEAKLRIFMVDDSKVTCLMVADLLASESDWSFEYTTDPVEALKRLEASPTDIILQDIHMPVIDGFELLNRYKQHPDLANIPVLMLTSEDSPQIKEKAFLLGASDYLAKTSDRLEFVARVRYHAQRYQEYKKNFAGLVQSAASLQRNVRVLLVDRSPIVGKILTRMFADEKDLHLSHCTDPSRMIADCEENLPSVILLSLLAGESDGWERVRELRRHPSCGEAPILIYTTTNDPEEKAKAFESGANDYIVKSCSKIELLARIRKHASDYFGLMRSRTLVQAESSLRDEFMRVLIVDESATFCHLLVKTLASEKQIVAAFVTNPDLIWDKLKEFRPTVLFLGLVFPNTDGLGVLRKLRGNLLSAELPILMLSSTEEPLVKGRAFAFGANDYILKTADKIELVSRILYHSRAYINGQRLNDTIQRMIESQKRLEIHSQFIRRTFGRYLSNDIVDSILNSAEGLQLGGETRELTIMMTDLRGFTPLAESLPPKTVISLLNVFFEIMTGVILECGGTIDEFQGDAILVIFGAPLRQADHAERAVACAIKMQNAMKLVNARSPIRHMQEIEMGIGINTGEVVVGNIGSAKRTKYGVVGSAVNLASRVESHTTGGQILISEMTFRKLEGLLRIKGHTQVELKGMKGPATLYDIAGIGGSYPARMEAHAAMEPLQPLKHPIRVSFVLYEGKSRATEFIPATLEAKTRVSLRLRSPFMPGLHQGLQVIFPDSPTGIILPEIDAKVIELDSKGNRFVVQFPQLSAEKQQAFDRYFGPQGSS